MSASISFECLRSQARKEDAAPYGCHVVGYTFTDSRAAMVERLLAFADADGVEALYSALPCIEESEQFDKSHAPKLSKTVRGLIAILEGTK